MTGKFYTSEQFAEIEQKEWQKDSLAQNWLTVREDWNDEKAFRREQKEPFSIGYLIRIGSKCASYKHLDGLFVPYEDAIKTIELLPPYSECKYDTCECTFDPVSSKEIPRGTRIAELKNSNQGEANSIHPSRKSKTSCLVTLFAILSGLIAAGIMVLQI